jgi:hypothetical protein
MLASPPSGPPPPPPPNLPNGQPASELARITATIHMGGKQIHSHTVTLAHRVRAVVLAGFLRAKTGNPIVGAVLTIEALPPSGVNGWPRLIGTTVTNAAGHYSVRVRVGPSEVIGVRYRAQSLDSGYAASVWRTINVRPVVNFSAPTSIARGVAIKFQGRVVATQIPARGVVILVQAVRGSQWLTFAYGHTDARGRYSIRYTFDPGPVSWHQIRVLVPLQAAFPWARGVSRTLNVLVY